MARPRQVSDTDLLAAARACFLEHGPGVSVTTIAKAVGLSQAAVFKRFGTKECLLVRALNIPEQIDWIDQAAAGPDDRPVPEQLIELGSAMLAFFNRFLPRLIVLKSHGLSPHLLLEHLDNPPPVRAQQALTSFLTTLVDTGRVRPLNPELAAISLLGQFQSRAFWRHMLGRTLTDDSDEAYVRQAIDIFWTGTRPEES